jgi:hypothetical protein
MCARLYTQNDEVDVSPCEKYKFPKYKLANVSRHIQQSLPSESLPEFITYVLFELQTLVSCQVSAIEGMLEGFGRDEVIRKHLWIEPTIDLKRDKRRNQNLGRHA